MDVFVVYCHRPERVFTIFMAVTVLSKSISITATVNALRGI